MSNERLNGSKVKEKISALFVRDRHPLRGLLAAEWVAVAYLLLTLVMMAVVWPRLVNADTMLWGRLRFVAVTAAAWLAYRWFPCRALIFVRVTVQMVFLSWWYPDTYELNRVLPNLDHVFATCEQAVFGCQPALLFAEKIPWPWFSEVMCMSYVSYFTLILIVTLYYFIRRTREFLMAAFVILASFFAFYVVFILLPVTGPQFYYLAAGTDNIANGVFPNLGDWFLTHSERMQPPGWPDGFWYHMLDITHDAGERPTAAFPSSHVGITTVVMLLALRTRSKALSLVIFPFYFCMCFSTVYIMAHYAIDAVAGLVCGTLLYLAMLGLYTQKKGLR